MMATPLERNLKKNNLIRSHTLSSACAYKYILSNRIRQQQPFSKTMRIPSDYETSSGLSSSSSCGSNDVYNEFKLYQNCVAQSNLKLNLEADKKLPILNNINLNIHNECQNSITHYDQNNTNHQSEIEGKISLWFNNRENLSTPIEQATYLFPSNSNSFINNTFIHENFLNVKENFSFEMNYQQEKEIESYIV